MSHYFKIGKLVASFGLKGELVLQHSLGKKSSFKGLQAVFLEETRDNFIPYFIEKTSIKNDAETFVKLEGIDSPEAARKLTPKEVWLQETDFQKYTHKAAPIALLGFEIMDGETPIGQVIEVIEQPHQILCTVIYNGKEALIPVHAENLINIDTKNKKIVVELPEGLLDVFM